MAHLENPNLATSFDAREIDPPSPFDEEWLQTLLHGCQSANASLVPLPEGVQAQLEQGATLGEMRGLTEEDYAALYSAASYLLAQQRFNDALQIGLQLAMHEPRDYRHPLVAAIAAHRLQHWSQATALYGMSLAASPTPSAAFRMGECLMQLGDSDRALECFAVVESLSEGNEEHAHLSAWAAENAQALRAS